MLQDAGEKAGAADKYQRRSLWHLAKRKHKQLTLHEQFIR
jgi:hypothetical protein